MSALEQDAEMLETALRSFFQTIKRPQHWADVTAKAGVNLDRPAAVILHTLVTKNKPLRVQDLALQLGIEAPSVTRKTQELGQLGYLERVPDPVDRRAVSLKITPEGREVSNKLWKIQRDRLRQVLKNWDPAERRQFVELLQRYSNDVAANAKSTK